MQGSAWPGKVGRGSRQHGWGLPVPPARLGSAGRTAPGLRARSPRCQHAEIGVPMKQEALRGLRGSPAPALPTPVLREGSRCKTLLSPLLLGASPGCVVVTPGPHRELSTELGAGAGAAAGWAAGRRPRAVPSPSPAAVPERGPRRWCVLAAGIPWPASGRTTSTTGTVSTVGTVGTVAPFPSQGCNFGLLARCCARPAAVPRAPGHRCFVPRDKAPSRGRAEAPPCAGARLPLIELGARHGAEGWQ